jgi:hypothetical protein
LRSRVQRRGTHVNIPEIGSRDGGNCFGGILEFYAELRREFGGGNLKLVIFGFLAGALTWGWEEGGTMVCIGGI